MCDLLHALWRLERRCDLHGKAVQLDDLAAELGASSGSVSVRVHRLNKHSVGVRYIAINSFFPKGNLRKRRSVYSLIGSTGVTSEDTAVMLLALVGYPHKFTHKIERLAFVNHVVETYGFAADWVERSITWAIKQSYLYADKQRRFIFPHERIDRERGYLELLAQHARQPTSFSISRSSGHVSVKHRSTTDTRKRQQTAKGGKHGTNR